MQLFSATRIVATLAGALLLTSSLSHAEDVLTADPEAGKAKAASCASCHGAEGISNSPQWPHLAGQVPGYIAIQLHEFKKGAEGERNNAIMAGMAAALSDQDIADIDAYYSTLPANKGFVTPEQEETALAGKKVYRSGFADFEVPACMGCHGPAGAGIAPKFPRIAGLPKEYIAAQLQAFKAGTRSNLMMSPIAYPLTEQQIEALSAYISGLN
ncbi:MAG: cytochrome c4 [Acidiferrobacterales bacterium]|nr:cytochrome c4 [Acidiferrobacterales bacterium]